MHTKHIKKNMLAACKSNDKDLCKQLLLNWGKNRFPDEAPTSLGQLGICCGDPIKSQLAILNSALYDDGTNDKWDGRELSAAFLQCYKTIPEKTSGTEQILKPLQYKVAS